jgi:hypothetical protein
MPRITGMWKEDNSVLAHNTMCVEQVARSPMNTEKSQLQEIINFE